MAVSEERRPSILVSACLVGQPVRYDGGVRTPSNPTKLAAWRDEGRLVSICPEMAAGFGVPRLPAEIRGGTGDDVLDGRARVVDRSGRDVTAAFIEAAHRALDLARRHDCRAAVLTDRSPSCGSREIYDGTFSGDRTAGAGVVAALLRRHGVAVYGDDQVDVLAKDLGEAAD
ncbi:DUF523 domain-containing protein [Consotaella aegiceratis]|uniref:DUF523 domain-containing protein n=1 Tax=Consotaella aegiceratis TaxID=3097961 RepID=UPI002F41FB86